MDDNKNLNQPNNATPNNDDYQKILDQYAASIKPEEDVNDVASPAEDTIKLETVKEDSLSLKDINSLQIEAPDNKSISATTLKTEPLLNTQPLNIEPPIVDQPPKITETKPNIETPIVSQPTTETKTPEEIKAQIDKIFADDSSSSSFPPSKTKSFAKNFFFLSIAIFFLVAASWIYFLYFYQQPTTKTVVTTISPTPTETVSEETCELNDITYKVGESFKSADGCNTCSCQTGNTIACTEMACNISPTVTSPATKSATKTPTKVTLAPTTSAIPKDWKIYSNSTYNFSFNYPTSLKVVESTKAYNEANGTQCQLIKLGSLISINVCDKVQRITDYGLNPPNGMDPLSSSDLKIGGQKAKKYNGGDSFDYVVLSPSSNRIEIYLNSTSIDKISELEKVLDTLKFN